MSIRSIRKWQHIQHALNIPPGPKATGFKDVHLVHHAVSCLNLNDINTEFMFLGKNLKFPLLINALTGGALGLEKINKSLAIAAKECGIALAVGSQSAALDDPSLTSTFQIVREVNPKGVILANVSALVNPKLALQAVEMIDADGLQLHLNLTQELIMAEGDRNFKRLLENIKLIKEISPVPVIIKEVGFGLSLEAVNKLMELDISFYDIGGAGGTNFAAIEIARNNNVNNDDLLYWGVPTVISLIETLEKASKTTICASGGIYSPVDIVKSLALGANLVGIATPFLQLASRQNVEVIVKHIENLIKMCKEIMLLVDAQNLINLQEKPVVITGFTREWLEVRGIGIQKFARRGL